MCCKVKVGEAGSTAGYTHASMSDVCGCLVMHEAHVIAPELLSAAYQYMQHGVLESQRCQCPIEYGQ